MTYRQSRGSAAERMAARTQCPICSSPLVRLHPSTPVHNVVCEKGHFFAVAVGREEATTIPGGSAAAMDVALKTRGFVDYLLVDPDKKEVRYQRIHAPKITSSLRHLPQRRAHMMISVDLR